MALLSGQLDSVPLMAEEDVKTAPNGDVFGIDQVGGLPLGVDYRSPVSHFVPPAVELMQRQRHELASSAESSSPSTPVKRKRGRPRVDKTSPEYLATVAARKQAREMASGNLSSSPQPSSGEKRKRGRPRVDKTSPEYLARKRAREMEALERKAKREYRRRTGEGDSPSGENRVKRKYTKRAANDASGSDRVKGKRGRPRKVDQLPTEHPQHAKIRVRSNLMPSSSEPITLDSDDDNDLGSPRDSISFDENLRALRHIREKYANIDKDDLYEAHLLAANCKKPETRERNERETSMTAQDLHSVEKLEDSDSDSDSSTSSGSSSSSSGSSSSSNSSSSGSSDTAPAHNNVHHDGSLGAWSSKQDSESDSDPERKLDPKDLPPRSLQDEISESENESPDKSFQCHICHKWYSTRVTLKIHRRSHQTRAVEGRSRRNDRKTTDDGSNDDSRHRRDRDERRGRCSDCHNTYHSPDALRRHRAQAHGAGAGGGGGGGGCAGGGGGAGGGHACSVCGKRFTHAHSLTRHMHNHAKQLYRCVVCKASFARADQLAQHLNSHLANYKRLKP